MPELRYALAALRELRQRIADACQRQLAAAGAALTAAEAVCEQRRRGVDQAERTLDAHRQSRVQQPGATISAMQEQQQYETRLERSRDLAEDELQQANVERDRCRQAWDEARTALTTAQKELKLVDQHHARWTEQQRQAEQKRAERELEDLATIHGVYKKGKSA